MNHHDQEMLVGYLLGALEERECLQLEDRLRDNGRLRHRLEELREELSPILECGDHSVDPPDDLARRTCRALWDTLDGKHHHETVEERFTEVTGRPPRRVRFHVLHSEPPAKQEEKSLSLPEEIFSPKSPRAARRASVEASPRSAVASKSRSRRHPSWGDSRPKGEDRGWSLADVIASISVGILLALLLFPAIQYARHRTHILMCQNKLRQIGENFVLYSHAHGGAVPTATGASATIDAPLLRQSAMLQVHDAEDSSWGDNHEVPRFEVPSPENAMAKDASSDWQADSFLPPSNDDEMIGYLIGGRYRPVSGSFPPRLAILSGMSPIASSSSRTAMRNPYGGIGRNVLYRDGHVRLHTAAGPDLSKILSLQTAGRIDGVGQSQNVLLEPPELPEKP
jgi:hypothetical protein